MSIAIRRNVRRAGVALMAAVVAAALCLNAAMPAHADDKQKELENKKNELQSELDQIRQQLKDVASDKAEAEQQKQLLVQEKNTIKGQIDALNDQIDDISAQIVEKEQQITDKQAEIDQKQAEYDDRWAKYKEQVVSMQMLDQGGGIALLSTAENIYQLLTFDQVLQDISDANTQACEDLEQQGIELTNERTQLEEAKASLEEDEEELQNQKSQQWLRILSHVLIQYKIGITTQELASNIQAQDASISAAAAQEQALEEAKSDKQAEFDKAADEYDAYLKSLIAQTQRNYANAPISCSLNFICPLPSYKYISCQYGSGGHKGVDFAAPGGTNIRAVASGVVTVSGWHYSYGNYVMIYHGTDDQGNTYATLYAHMNSTPPVSVGQSVSQGDVIGYVGTTGNSTGNHLHLELRVNGARTNPLNYVPH